MNKKDLAIAIVEKTDNELSLAAASRAVDAVTSTVAEALAAGDKVSLHGFGTFRVKGRGPREYRNPQTGEPVLKPATKAVVFRPGDALKDTINS